MKRSSPRYQGKVFLVHCSLRPNYQHEAIHWSNVLDSLINQKNPDFIFEIYNRRGWVEAQIVQKKICESFASKKYPDKIQKTSNEIQRTGFLFRRQKKREI